MPASQPANFNLQEFTDAGQLLVGGRLYTYGYGTTAQKTAFTDPAGTVPHTYTNDGVGGQYIALNARGELPATLYLGAGSYDIALKRADGSTVWTRKADGVENSITSWITALAASLGSSLMGFIQTGVGAIKRTVQDKLRERVSIEDFGVVGQGEDDTAVVQKAINAAALAGMPLFCSAQQLIVTGLTLPSRIDWTLGTTILKRKDGANVPLLRNESSSFVKNQYNNEAITIRGGILDLNGMGQGDVGTDGAWLVGVRFAGVKGLEFHGTVFKNSRRFNIFIVNCTRIRAYNTEIINDPAIPSHNKDGYHINGNVSDFYADVITARFSDDDAVALNADDMEFGGDLTLGNICGAIEDVHIGMVRCLNTRNGVRLLSASNRIRNVQIDAITGDVSVYALNMQDYGLGSDSWYQNIRIGTIDCLFSKRAYPEASMAMVNIETPNHSTDAYSDIYIGSIHRSQNDEDGQDRATVNFTALRTKLQIGEISEFNCKNRFAVQMNGGSAGAKFELGRHQRWNSRPDAGIYGSVIRVASSVVGNAIDFIKIDEVQADRLQHVALLQNATVVQFDVEKLTPTDNAPIYLDNATIQRLFWKAIDTQSYGLSSNRYFRDQTSVVSFERPAPLGGTTEDRPTNAAYGDSFLDITIGKPIWWSGAWRDSTGTAV